MNTINGRISRIIKHYGLNPTSFARRIGQSNNVSITNIVNNKTKPSYQTLASILAEFKAVSGDWLLTGNGSMLKETNDIAINNELKCANINERSSIIVSDNDRKCDICTEKDKLINRMDELLRAKDRVIDELEEKIHLIKKHHNIL